MELHDQQVNSDKKRIALLIDVENAPASKVDVVLAEVARHGVATVRRAYGNWKSPRLQQWEAALHPYAIRPMQQFAYSTGKNSADMAMVIDAMDLLRAGSIDAFALLSSDADFTPLVMRILADGLKVYGFGENKTPKPFVNACSQFTYVESLRQLSGSTRASTGGPSVAKSVGGDAGLVLLMRNAVEAARGDDGWANLAAVGQQISNQASLDPRNYGYRKLSDLIEATELFQVKRQNLGVFVRDRGLAVSGAPRRG
ncbi:NYN domain-containing protein [Nesterenkonia sp. YGD6]|uniref:NYN domain-containing protein n=1 Tax=Nesterenkonia sp. YGD6 TaxID=2901231 RepID=UPI001F4CE32F|nr:NYN domain-containing protein [Nesterenkonia sp. YGD6]